MEIYFAALLFSSALSVLASMTMKYASHHNYSLISWPVFLSCCIFASAFASYYFCLRKIPLSFSQPFAAGVVIVCVNLFSWWFFGETLSYIGFLGLFLIISGIILINI